MTTDQSDIAKLQSTGYNIELDKIIRLDGIRNFDHGGAAKRIKDRSVAL